MTDLLIERVRTSGIFSLDGQDYDVENNVWLVGNNESVLVVDAAHDSLAILDAIGDRKVAMIVCTHGHNDHINAAADLARTVRAPIALHPDDEPLWHMVYPDRTTDIDLSDGDTLDIAGESLTVLHTPGHSPGGVCLQLSHQKVVFSGDTLFRGGPGATGRSFSSFSTIIKSIKAKLFTLAQQTVVHTGHGDDTTIGTEMPHLDEWIERGY